MLKKKNVYSLYFKTEQKRDRREKKEKVNMEYKAVFKMLLGSSLPVLMYVRTPLCKRAFWRSSFILTFDVFCIYLYIERDIHFN